ncbi:UMF1 family MFS transporter [Rubricella aquisinus]|uniref:UMF1 family MFS transporter n=1 Tax=Rubricella aquisinus TaxID=2028108 RepID=A0A840X437_9RHOB|nr:MFS transporter [Rubricella aquisinus]MBB5515427.1 UMF1 family MFS transporter [Rubricella aquisinus]
MSDRAQKKGIWGWMLFDWASQPFHTLLITFIFSHYFVNRVVADPVAGQAQWAFMLSIAGFIIAIMAPFLGAFADAAGPRKPWIAFFSIFYVVGAGMLWLAVPGMMDPTIVLIGFAIGLIGAEFATVFTNAMLPDLGPREEVGRVSGSGWAMGYWGGLVSLIIVLGFMVGDPETGSTRFGTTPILGLDPAMGEGERGAGILTSIWYIVFIIPLFLWTRDAPRRATKGAFQRGLGLLVQNIKTLSSRPSFASYLMSSMFYRDALNGLYMFGGIYAGSVLGWSIVEVGTFGLLANVTGALGAWAGGRIDRAQGPKLVIRGSIWLLIGVCLAVVMTDRSMVLMIPVAETSALPDILFYVCGAVIGAAGGSLQAASRTMLVHQSEEEAMTQSFGLYALTGKATSFLAPMLIGWATLVTESQRLGIAPVIGLFIIGIVILYWVKPQGDVRVQPA